MRSGLPQPPLTPPPPPPSLNPSSPPPLLDELLLRVSLCAVQRVSGRAALLLALLAAAVYVYPPGFASIFMSALLRSGGTRSS